MFLNNLLNVVIGGADWKQNVLNSLQIMWKGCLAIFLVIAVVIAAVLLLRYATDSIAKKKSQKKNDTSKTE